MLMPVTGPGLGDGLLLSNACEDWNGLAKPTLFRSHLGAYRHDSPSGPQRRN